MNLGGGGGGGGGDGGGGGIGRGGGRGGSGGAYGDARSKHSDGSCHMDLNPRNESGMGRQKSALSTLKGARTVWGTLRSTSTVAVSNALKLVPEIPSGSIIVKRKYKPTPETAVM